MKVLNLFSGLGGNRKLWGDEHDITAVEYREDIAKFYSVQYPQDRVVVGDAHQYLLDCHSSYDFIWSSCPCPTHSRARFWSHQKDNPVYPDMSLYQEILLLQHTFKGLWVVENVVPYYDPLIPASVKLGRHLFWSSFHIHPFNAEDADIHGGTRDEWQRVLGIDITGYRFQDRTDKLLRNCVMPEVGQHILNCAMSVPPESEQISIF